MELPQMNTIVRPIEYLLSGISSTSAIITRFIRSVRVAHPDLAAVTRDLSDLRLMLELIREESSIPLLLQAQMLQVLECCGNVLIHIDTVLAQCPEAAKWVASGRTEMASCRYSLGMFREAMALALEVATLSTLQGNQVEFNATKDNITREVQRLQADAQSARHSDYEATSALFPYLNAISSTMERFPNSPAESQGVGSKEILPDPATHHLNQKRHFRIQSFDNSPSSSPSFPLPYYTREPESLNPGQTQEQRQLSPSLPESPILLGMQARPRPVAQNSLPPPLSRPSWEHRRSLSTKSEPHVTGYSNREPPSFLGRWVESVQNLPQRYSPQEPSSATSIASAFFESGRLPSRQSRARTSIIKTPVSAYGSGSVSPSFPSTGFSTPGPVSPFPFSLPLSPPPEYRRTPTPRSSNQQTNPLITTTQLTIPVPTRHNIHQSLIEVTPNRHLTDKGKSKGCEILHIDTSPSSSFIATKHASKSIKMWSIPKNKLHGTIKITSYVQPKVRSREYFIRSHAILSEDASLIAITTHFGLTLEIHNFAKGGSAKKVQVIDEAHRWAASYRDAFHNDYAALAVYRPKGDRIDRFFLSRYPNAKQPCREDPSHSIELLKADLPFIPKFPELAYSSDSPFLLAAAGPRPGDPPRTHATILIAWLMKPISEAKLHAQTPNYSSASLPDEARHKPYRVCVPEYPALQTALPACLVSHGSTAVSVWIPANSVSARERYVLIWDLPSNQTRIFAIPNVQTCVSPDCRRLAYCDAESGQFVIVDVASAEEVWRWPDVAKARGFASFGQLENLKGVTVFEFSTDGRTLVVGDASGGVGVYMVEETGARFELGVGSEVAAADVFGARRNAGARFEAPEGVGELP